MFKKQDGRRPWSGKKKFAVLGVVPVLLMAGTAAAYFLSEGSGTGTTHITNGAAPTAQPLTITDANPVEVGGGPLVGLIPETAATPGNIQAGVWAVSNPSQFAARVAHISVSMAHDSS